MYDLHIKPIYNPITMALPPCRQNKTIQIFLDKNEETIGIFSCIRGENLGTDLSNFLLIQCTFDATFYSFFLVNWFHLLYKGMNLGENCFIVIKLMEKSKLSNEH